MEPKKVCPRKKGRRSKRGSGITKKIELEVLVAKSEVEDDDPFVDCDSQKWSLEMALEHVKKFHSKKANSYTGYRGGPVTPTTFELFSNSLVVILFRLYAKLETELQNSLRIFYFGLEKNKLSRFRNLTTCLHKHNVFHKYPWLTTDEKLREPVDIKTLCRRKRNGGTDDEPKPFSEACKQYEIEKRRNLKIQKYVNIKVEPGTIDENSFSLNVNQLHQPNSQLQLPITDKHLLLSQEYKNMLSAINQHETLDEENPKCIATSSSSRRKRKRSSRWSSPPTNTSLGTNKLTPIMHFENRKIKLTTEIPLSLGDLIVLVSYFYKLEYIEQQLLIEKMKILETTKPNQAAYLRQYVRTTCPAYNENEIHFKPLPEELIASEIDMDLHDVTCIEDILENDFCVFDDGIDKKCIKNENASIEASNEFDFGSAFL